MKTVPFRTSVQCHVPKVDNNTAHKMVNNNMINKVVFKDYSVKNAIRKIVSIAAAWIYTPGN